MGFMAFYISQYSSLFVFIFFRYKCSNFFLYLFLFLIYYFYLSNCYSNHGTLRRKFRFTEIYMNQFCTSYVNESEIQESRVICPSGMVRDPLYLFVKVTFICVSMYSVSVTLYNKGVSLI